MPNDTPSLRILHITASSMIGGGPEHVWQLVRHLPKNIESFIAAPTCEPYGGRFMEAVGEDHFISIPQRKFSLRAFLSLRAFIKQNNISIIHSHGKGAGIYGRLAALCTGVTSVHTFHGIHLPLNAIFRHLYICLERFLCSISKLCIAVSDGEAEEVKRCGFAFETLRTIHNGVFVPEQLLQRKMPNPFTILHVSRFDVRQKNSLMLYDIALALQKKELLGQVNFVLVGAGEELAILQDKIAQAGLAEFFTYVGQQKSVQPFYEAAACILSTSRWEGMPLAVLEAQAFGVPAIASDVVGNRDAVQDGKTGFLFKLNDNIGVVDYIEKLIKNHGLWEEMSYAAWMQAQEKFSVQNMAKLTAKVYLAGHKKIK